MERFPLPLGAWDGHRYFIVALPEPSINYSDFDIVNFPFLDGAVSRRPSYGVYISQLIRSARVCSHVDDFNARNKCLTDKLLKQSYRYHKLRKAFSMFSRRRNELVSKFNVRLKSFFYIKAYRNQNFMVKIYNCLENEPKHINKFNQDLHPIEHLTERMTSSLANPVNSDTI